MWQRALRRRDGVSQQSLTQTLENFGDFQRFSNLDLAKKIYFRQGPALAMSFWAT